MNNWWDSGTSSTSTSSNYYEPITVKRKSIKLDLVKELHKIVEERNEDRKNYKESLPVFDPEELDI